MRSGCNNTGGRAARATREFVSGTRGQQPENQVVRKSKMSSALISPDWLKSAPGARAYQAFRKSRTSRVSVLPEWLKSEGQAPTRGREQGLGEQATPTSQEPAAAAQRVCVSRRQVAAEVLQQAAGTAQVLGVQVPPANQSCAARAHSDSSERKHVPVTTLQQRPCGGGQGFGAQTPEAIQVLPEAQRVCVKRRQVPAAMLQQAPGIGQVLGVQVRPAVQSCAAGAQSG